MNFKFEKQYNSANATALTVETTGYIEGDAGNGCCTKIVITDKSSTALTHNGTDLSSEPLEIEIRGGCEYDTFTKLFI